MNGLSKAQLAEIAEFTSKLETLSAEIEDEQAGTNAKIGDLNEQIQRYNNILKNVRDFRDGIVQSMHDYAADKPEGWADGDEGSAYQSWVDEWEDADLEFVKPIDEIEVDEHNHAQTLENLPLEP